MTFKDSDIKPNTPIPLDQVFVGPRPGSDARFRGSAKLGTSFDLVRAHEAEREAARQAALRKIGR